MKNILQQILDPENSGARLVLATVVRTSGSTPQKPGSSALFGKQGLISGTVGGGVVEGRVVQLAEEAIHSGISGLYHFDLDNDISRSEEAICGGRISVLMDAGIMNHKSVLEQLKISLDKKIPGVLVTKVITTSSQPSVIDRYWMSDDIKLSVSSLVQERIKSGVKKLLSDRNPGDFDEIGVEAQESPDLTTFFLQPFFPPDMLVIAGAGHIGRALAHLGNILGFQVTVIDDRREFANSDNIPDAGQIIVKDIGEAMNGLKGDDNTYVVIVTRGHKDDAAALRPCIGKKLAYTGMIGSKSKIAAMRHKFIEEGWASEDQWDKIHTPVGLQIKSRTVEEIAVSIAAELILVRNSRT